MVIHLINVKIKQNLVIYLGLLPLVGNHGKLGPCPRPWGGGGTAHRITALFRLRARYGGLRAWHRRGRGDMGRGPDSD